MLSPTKIVNFKDFTRLLSDFPVLFMVDVFLKDFSRKPSKFKYFSSLCEHCIRPQKKKCIITNQFSFIPTKTYVVGTQKNHLIEMILLSIQNIFYNYYTNLFVLFDSLRPINNLSVI